MLIVVTGGREWNDPYAVDAWLHEVMDKMGKPYERITIRHGDARGFDRMCGCLAKRYGLGVQKRPADWDRFGKSAGFKRNIAMLEEEPVPLMVAGFKDNFDCSLSYGGTEHCIRMAKWRGLPFEVRNSANEIVLDG